MRVLLIALTCCVSWNAFGQTASPPQPIQIRELVSRADYKAALRICNDLVAYWKDALDANHEFFVGYYLLARAQVFTLSGDLTHAEESLSEARNSVSVRSRNFMLGAPFESLVNETKGFLEEKKGSTQSAMSAYRNADSEKGYGRMALLSVLAGRMADAKHYAAKDPNSPTSLFVSGKVAQNAGNQAEATNYFVQACDKLKKVLDAKSDAGEFMPIFVCEAANIRSACAGDH